MVFNQNLFLTDSIHFGKTQFFNSGVDYFVFGTKNGVDEFMMRF